MPEKKSKNSNVKAETQLAKEVKALSKEIKKLKNLEFLRVFKNPWKFMLFSFLKGLMVGFGSILGASVLVGFFIYALAQISFVPILGDFVEEIISQISIEQRVKAPDSTQPDIIDRYKEKKENIENGEISK